MSAELNDREKSIVDLINKLSEVADDETSTQNAIDSIVGQIKQKTASDIKEEIKNAENMPPRSKPQFPNMDVSNGIRDGIMDERLKMLEEISRNAAHSGQQLYQGQLTFTRIREVKAPVKAHPTDAGIDFFVPDAKAWDEGFRNMVIEYSRNPVPCAPSEGVEFIDDYLEVAPRAHVAIPSGIKTIIPQGLAMMMVNKSGVATKLKLDHSACLIDSEYRDELIFCFFNNNQDKVVIEPGMKITQGLIVPVINLELQEVLNCVYDDMGKETDRGGGFGSSGQK